MVDRSGIRVYPIRFLRNELRNLVGSAAMWINKKSAVALVDVFDEKIDEKGGLAHA